MKPIFRLFLILLITNSCVFAQKQYDIRTVAFYNLENLFDTVNDTLKNDEASPIMGIKEGRDAVYREKLDNMAQVISEMGTTEAKNSPIILGIAEVENKQVIEDSIKTTHLKDKNYEIIHYDSPDTRGIDVALLYQPSYFYPIHHEPFELKLWDEKGRRIYTRDQLLVSGYLDDELVHIIVNHWPSRRSGEEKSRQKIEKAAY